MPVDMVVYTTLLTLVVFLFIKLPGIWKEVGLERPAGKGRSEKTAAAIALASNGLLALTIQFLMAPTHTIGGINWADVWHVTLSLIGVGLILAGIAVLMFRQYQGQELPKCRHHKSSQPAE